MQKTPAPHPPQKTFILLKWTEWDTTPSWEAWLSLREFYLSLKVTELGLWNAMPLRTLETYIQLSISDEKNWSPEEKRLPKTAQRISAELDSEFRAYHPLGRAPFWVIGLCSPILGIWYISLCIIVSLKAISWEKKGISSLKILALPYERGFVYWRPVLSLRFLTVILGSIKQGNRVCTLAR